MKLKLIIFILFSFFELSTLAQSINVHADYTSFGDVEFIAYNNTDAPLFLYLNFDNLENTSFDYPLPYIKRLQPGFNNLFILERYLDSEYPRFNYTIDQYISNPLAEVDLNYPYILPFAAGANIQSIDIDSLDIEHKEYFKNFYATAFLSNSKDIMAVRNGIVVDIKDPTKTGNSNYPGLQNSITVLQSDGTLLTYQNINVPNQLKLGNKIFAGKPIGKLTHLNQPIILFITKSEIETHNLLPIIPKFLTDEKTIKLIIGNEKFSIIHPKMILGKEMTRKEKRKYLK